jgi:hypothetical protein
MDRRWKYFGKMRENSDRLVVENKKDLRYGPGILPGRSRKTREVASKVSQQQWF